MNNYREEFKQFLTTWLDEHLPEVSGLAFDLLVLIWIGVFAIALHVFLQVYLRRLLVRLANSRGNHWQRALLENRLFQRLAYVLQGAIVHIQAGLWLDDDSPLRRILEVAADQWILLFALLSFFAVLNAIQSVMHQRAEGLNFPLRGLIQTMKLVSSILVGLVAVAVLMGKSPLILLSGLGALSAVLMLVFKDAILGLVAGIQLSANRMLAVGDWLEMPKYGADGDVIDIALTTVKVRNWDKTITTVPTYALISDSFKNWRGMSESGGRRIKRSILLDTSSIRFLDEALLEHLRKADLLGDYLESKTNEIERANSKTDLSCRLNGRRLTNVGTFRGYLVSYLKAHPDIHQDMTLMVRQLESTSEGLPLQIYAFTNTTAWTAYEDIQADIFDHVFAVLPEFDLRIHESPTGQDIRALSGSTTRTSDVVN